MALDTTFVCGSVEKCLLLVFSPWRMSSDKKILDDNLSAILMTFEGLVPRTKSMDVCPVAFAGSLDNKIRRWLQNPEKIFEPYINKGMTVLDLGCGSGLLTIDLAHRLVQQAGSLSSICRRECSKN
jgi:2-polyprenyl-3-methyl-5-hydroxy-6-metoxy-1,4-benzoquinol methylase